MKLTYWIAECLDDSRHYTVKAKTKKEVEAMLAERDRSNFGPVKKVTVEYSDGFDLMAKCSGEDWCYWES
jgi:hypothetical protein